MTPTLAQALSLIAPAYSAAQHTRAAERMVQDMETTTRLPGPWIEKVSGPDRAGRFSYFVHWLDDYHPGHPEGEHRLGLRGQIFFADPVESGHAKYDKWDGGRAARAAIAKARGQ